MNHSLKIGCGALFIWLCCAGATAKPARHYVFFGQDREKIKAAASFLETKALEGARVAYSWRQPARCLQSGEGVEGWRGRPGLVTL
jgi:hypothetical protein